MKKFTLGLLLLSCALVNDSVTIGVTRSQADGLEQASKMNNMVEQVDISLQHFSAAAKERLGREIFTEAFDGVISAPLVNELATMEDASIPELMLKFLPLASQYALPPVSNFRVGAVIQGETGALYLGANLEIAQAALGFVVHAEQSAINNALLHDEPSIRRIAVTAAPCGHCRQFLNELDAASNLEIIVVGRQPVTLTELLPASFGPADLGIEDALFSEAKLLKQPSKNHTSLQCPSRVEDKMLCLGRETAQQSYSPYSGSPSSVVLKVNGRFFSGAYIENAAYNPSLHPLLSALDRLRFQETDFSNIQELLLFESADAGISQASYTQAILSEIAPNAKLKIVKTEKVKSKNSKR